MLGHRDDSGLSETVCVRISDLLREKCMPQGMVLPPLFVTLGTKKDIGDGGAEDDCERGGGVCSEDVE